MVSVCVYWDKVACPQEWAYRVTDVLGEPMEVGSLSEICTIPDKASFEQLEGAVIAVGYRFGLAVEPGSIGYDRADGGCATWHDPDGIDDEICIDCGGENIVEGTCVDCQAKDCPELGDPIHEEPRRFAFATDSESGYIEAATFEAACEALRTFVPVAAVDNGGWGWVRNENGELFEIGC